jgi:hypothetical protein
MSDDTTDHPDLVALLRGELGIDDVLACETHLAACQVCRDDLVPTVAGHALLTRTSGVLAAVDLPAPPPFDTREVGRRPRPRTAVVAAAVALVAGTGLGSLATSSWEARGGGAGGEPVVSVTAVLDPVDGPGSGQVEMTSTGDRSTRMTIRTTGLPEVTRGDFYYAWLFDPSTQKMLPLGLVGPDGAATFRVDESLVAAYSAVDVSLETDDGDPGHSVTSVLRGTYDA